MTKQNKLLLYRAIFLFIITILFSIIIINEKKGDLFSNIVKKKFNSYIEDNYKEIKKDLIINEIVYKNNKYQLKLTSKNNPNYYFYLIYFNKKVKSTYQEDYLEGKSILTHIEKELQKETNYQCKISIKAKLTDFTDSVKEAIIKEANIKNLSIYTIEEEIKVKNWTSDNIKNSIIENIRKYDLNPKNYTFIVTNKNNITESIKISNITKEISNNNNFIIIINDIMNNDKTELLEKSGIKYKFLN